MKRDATPIQSQTTKEQQYKAEVTRSWVRRETPPDDGCFLDFGEPAEMEPHSDGYSECLVSLRKAFERLD